jgi:hypothetical protein
MVGFLAGQKEQLSELTRPGSPDRPSWMNIRLDDAEGLANLKIRFRPVVLRSLLGAGYWCLGDIRWVPIRQLMEYHYVGMKTARQIRAVVRTLEHSDTHRILSIVMILRSPALKPEICRVLERSLSGCWSGNLGYATRISLAWSTTSDANVGMSGFWRGREARGIRTLGLARS